LLIKLYCFFQYFNNNYRPIYHVESIVLYMVSLVHEFEPKDGKSHSVHGDLMKNK
jgi:ubiquitin-protein ligase